MKIVAVSGGFDPIHIGHIRMFEEAKHLGDKLVVILNNDNWVKTKKGYVFMSETERAEIIQSIRSVDKVIITEHEINDPDSSVCKELRSLQPDIYANGGDRHAGNIPEYDLCKKLGIEMAFNIGHGGKVQSSSELVKRTRGL